MTSDRSSHGYARLLRPLLLILICALLLAAALSYQLASQFIAPAQRPIGPPPVSLAAEAVDIDGIRGWFVPAASHHCVLLLHGLGADRRSMLARARLLRQHGYASLLIDLQAHGESRGEHMGFGHLEAAGAHAAVTLLRERFGCHQVAAVGQSLGGAAAVLGERPLAVDAMVLESVYADIESAAGNRMRLRFGDAGAWLTPLLTLQLQPRLGISAEQLQPIARIGEVRAPLLVMAGDADRYTPLEESQRLFAAASAPKTLWIVPGAAHVDLLRFAPQAYSQRLLDFLAQHLQPVETP